MISTVFFGLDGTLLETGELKALSYARAAVELRPEAVREAEALEVFRDPVSLPRREMAESPMLRSDLRESAGEHAGDRGRSSGRPTSGCG